MTVDLGPGVGLEELQRAVLAQLHSNVNSVLTELDEAWKPIDEAFAKQLGMNYVDSSTEPVAVFSDGHRPSFIDAPIELYPNISVMAYKAEPSPEQYDQGDTYINTVFVELMVKSPTYDDDGTDKIDAETIINRRTQRTADAVQRVISADPTLNNTVYVLQNPPTVDLTDVFVRRESVKTGGPKWLWQMARLEWKATKYTSF